MAAPKKPVVPKAFKARVTTTKKSGTVSSKVFNSRNETEAWEIAFDAMEELKLGSRITIAPTHVDDKSVDPDTFVEYLFQLTPVDIGESILYKSIAAPNEAEARVAAVIDETWILVGSAAPDENDYKTFIGATIV